MDGEHPLEPFLAKSVPAADEEKAATAPSAMGSEQRQDVERSRRQAMSELYATLRALLPNLFPRATRARIIEEASRYVRVLQDTVAVLEAYKEVAVGGGAVQGAHAPSAWGGRDAKVAVSAGAVFFAVRLAARAGVLTRVLEVFHRHGAAVLAAAVACDGGEATVTVTTVAVEPEVVDSIKADILSVQ